MGDLYMPTWHGATPCNGWDMDRWQPMLAIATAAADGMPSFRPEREGLGELKKTVGIGRPMLNFGRGRKVHS